MGSPPGRGRNKRKGSPGPLHLSVNKVEGKLYRVEVNPSRSETENIRSRPTTQTRCSASKCISATIDRSPPIKLARYQRRGRLLESSVGIIGVSCLAAFSRVFDIAIFG